MKLHKDSHLDHGITDAQLGHLLQRFEGRREFFVATVELPSNLGDVPLGLFGPIVGDEPVHWAGCGRRCGLPADAVPVVATAADRFLVGDDPAPRGLGALGAS